MVGIAAIKLFYCSIGVLYTIRTRNDLDLEGIPMFSEKCESSIRRATLACDILETKSIYFLRYSLSTLAKILLAFSIFS